jgi:hypothetical protein
MYSLLMVERGGTGEKCAQRRQRVEHQLVMFIPYPWSLAVIQKLVAETCYRGAVHLAISGWTQHRIQMAPCEGKEETSILCDD